jgi:hypothetical protein
MFDKLSERLFGSGDGCDHQNIAYVPGKCTDDDVHLSEGRVILTTYQPYYRQCEDCGEISYETRHTADGRETPLGEPIKSTEIPHHVTSDYIREHYRTMGDCEAHQ